MDWKRLLRRRPREVRTLEDEAWLMRAEERTAENERRLIELCLQVQESVFARNPHWKGQQGS